MKLIGINYGVYWGSGIPTFWIDWYPHFSGRKDEEEAICGD